MKAVLYARVSSEKQAEKDLSISAQLKALRKYAVDRGWDIHREFIDEAESARTADRPAFQEMISLAKQKQKYFNIILVWKLSRFARNREDSIIYKSLLKKHGVSVLSINEQIDDSPAGKLFEGMIEVIDEFYSSNLAQDTIRGMKENITRGFRNGGIAPIGYVNKRVMIDKNYRTVLEIDDVFAPIVKRIYEMYCNGLGAKEIVKQLNTEGIKTNRGKPWNKTIVLYILTNEVYIGTLIWKEKKSNSPLQKKDELIKIENAHTAIIDKKLFSTVQNLIKQRSPQVSHPRTINSDYLLSGYIYCGKCGAKMIGASAKSGKFFYYACGNSLKKGKSVCSSKQINRNKLDSFIIDRVKRNILTEKNLIELVRLTNQELKNSKSDFKEQITVIDNQIKDFKKRLDNLYDALETGKLDIEYLAPRIKETKDQISNLELHKTKLEIEINRNESNLLNLDIISAYVSDLKSILGKGSIVDQKSFLKSFIKRITIDSPRVIIEYTIPIETKKTESSKQEVLSIESFGSPCWTLDEPLFLLVNC